MQGIRNVLEPDSELVSGRILHYLDWQILQHPVLPKSGKFLISGSARSASF